MSTAVEHSMRSNWSFPPKDFSKCIGILGNGELERSEKLKDKLQKFSCIIGVDGGINYCDALEIIPKWIVGDFDSVNPSLLKKYSGTDTIKLPRAKDDTDLEEGIKRAKHVSHNAQIIIYGGLGGRIDHTLNNTFILSREPGQVFLESEYQLLFALSERNGKIHIDDREYTTLALFPLNGPAEDITIITPYQTFSIPIIDKRKLFLSSFEGICDLKIENGEVIVILDKRKEVSYLQPEPPVADFSLSQPMIYIFQHLLHLSNHPKEVTLISNTEKVVSIHPFSEHLFSTQIGQTISLIPFYGPASGIATEGLKWELSKETIDALDKDFAGISNVCLKEEFSVRLAKGELLCIINQLIDPELVVAEVKGKKE